MKKRFGAFALSIILLLFYIAPASAARLGPAMSFEELLALAAAADENDVLLISGELLATGDQALTTSASLQIVSDGGKASITGLTLRDAQVVFSGVDLNDTLRIEGNSHVQLLSSVSVLGAPGRSGIEFSGSGTLLLDPGSSVTGGSDSIGVSVAHTGGDLYISLDGSVRGGAGKTGGAAVQIDPLGTSGALMITGTLTGGKGDAFGGNALNLHNLHGNAYLTIDGRLTGGEGDIGGSGLQLITADGGVTAGISGQITGGYGSSYGGDAMLLMNVGGSSSVSLSGMLTGGNASGADSAPGQSIKLLGPSTALHTYIGDCILQDGRQMLPAISVTPLPEITSSIDDAQSLATPAPTPEFSPVPSVKPSETPAPTPKPTTEPTAEPTVDPTTEPTAEPTVEPTIDPTAEPSAEPSEHTPEPTLEPADEPADLPIADPTIEPTAEPTSEPTSEPTAEPTAEPTTEPTQTPAQPSEETAP